MHMQEIDNTNVSKVLGKIVDYPTYYDSSILVREPRQSNRKHLDIDDNNLPFCGYDVWNAYEVSALTINGLPVSGIMKIIYPASSQYIVESKSLKLYLNSYNMSCMGKTTIETIQLLEQMVASDLSKLLETNVNCRFYSTKEIVNFNIDRTFIYDIDWSSYTTIEEDINLNDVKFSKYSEDPSLLYSDYKFNKRDAGNLPVQKFHTSLLKSNCRVTRQPDWGDVFIDITCEDKINPIGLAKYIVSFRDECHFHEEICETIYKRLNDIFKPTDLIVKCLYTRRGGIDICPARYSSEHLMRYSELLDVNIPYAKMPRQ